METKFYKKIFLTAGLADYNDSNEGVLLINKDTIDKAKNTLKGKPVIITHDGTEPVGKVVDVYFDNDKGAFVCGFNVWDNEAIDLLDNQNYSISCTYNILARNDGGTYHHINYDEEATEIEFENIAIVENPRYNEARQVLNSVEEDKKNGGAGSGNWGHSGRKGKIGGSAKETTGSATEHQKERRAYGRRLAELAKTFNTKNVIKNIRQKYKEIKKKKEEARLKEVAGKMIDKKWDDRNPNYKKGDNKRTERMHSKEYQKAINPNYKPEFETLVTTNRGAKLIKKDGKVAWVQSRMIRDDGTLTKGGLEALQKGMSEEAYNLQQKARENKQEILKDVKEKQNNLLKKNYGYDIDKDASDDIFKQMKKFAFGKYGNEVPEELKNKTLKITDDAFTNIRNILKNDATAKLDVNYWQTPDGNKKRLYFTVSNTGGYQYNLQSNYVELNGDSLKKPTNYFEDLYKSKYKNKNDISEIDKAIEYYSKYSNILDSAEKYYEKDKDEGNLSYDFETKDFDDLKSKYQDIYINKARDNFDERIYYLKERKKELEKF